jgi:hypothetical protein
MADESTVFEALAEQHFLPSDTATVMGNSVTRTGDGQTNPDE